ncbi:MAG: hypothetical protein N2449_09435 [Bacteroidales bacterium]|nr:hypothetical protein [Bacteroidales bacterium]
MRVLVSLLFLFLLLFSSCHIERPKLPQTTNLLVDTMITVSSLYSEWQQELPWKNSFKIRPLIYSLFWHVLNNKLVLYNPVYEDTVFKRLEKDQWFYTLKNEKNIPFDTAQFYDIYFYETWQLDTSHTFSLRKNILYWSPVKRENERMKLTGKVKCNSLQQKQLLTEQIIYEFSLTDSIFSNERLNKQKLIKILLEWAVKHPQKTYNPFTAKQLSKEELYKRLQIHDSIQYLPINDIQSILFVENWYYDPQSFSIHKEVLSLAPVLYIYDENEISKQILFMIHPSNKPFKIF